MGAVEGESPVQPDASPAGCTDTLVAWELASTKVQEAVEEFIERHNTHKLSCQTYWFMHGARTFKIVCEDCWNPPDPSATSGGDYEQLVKSDRRVDWDR